MNHYPHHIGDFNNATRHLTRIERSIYRDLLELYYDTEKPLTNDIDKLARRCLVDDDDRAALVDVLGEFFVATPDGYRNARADREIAAFQRMAEGGRKGADKRWGSDSHPIATPSIPHKPSDGHPMPTLCPPHAKANSNQNQNQLKTLVPSALGFDKFWAAYPKRKARTDAEKAWTKLRPNEQLITEILDAVERAKTSDDWTKAKGQFIPLPASWINGRRWLDEAPDIEKRMVV